MNVHSTESRLLTVEQAVQAGLYPNAGGLRWLIFKSHKNANGFAPAFKRIGRRVLVDEREFLRIVNEKNRSAN